MVWSLTGAAWRTELLPGVEVRATGREVGSMTDPGGDDAAVAVRRAGVVALPWTWLHQVHGSRVVVVERPGRCIGAYADAAVTREAGAVLAVLSADCAPVVLASPQGVIGVAHAGWRGLLAGVIEETVTAMRALGALEVVAALGPCIGPECYEFGAEPLAALAARLGPSVYARSASGGLALDLAAGVRACLQRADARLVADAAVCTSCSTELWSWRASGDVERQATVVWRET